MATATATATTRANRAISGFVPNDTSLGVGTVDLVNPRAQFVDWYEKQMLPLIQELRQHFGKDKGKLKTTLLAVFKGDFASAIAKIGPSSKNFITLERCCAVFGELRLNRNVRSKLVADPISRKNFDGFYLDNSCDHLFSRAALRMPAVPPLGHSIRREVGRNRLFIEAASALFKVDFGRMSQRTARGHDRVITNGIRFAPQGVLGNQHNSFGLVQAGGLASQFYFMHTAQLRRDQKAESKQRIFFPIRTLEGLDFLRTHASNLPSVTMKECTVFNAIMRRLTTINRLSGHDYFHNAIFATKQNPQEYYYFSHAEAPASRHWERNLNDWNTYPVYRVNIAPYEQLSLQAHRQIVQYQLTHRKGINQKIAEHAVAFIADLQALKDHCASQGVDSAETQRIVEYHAHLYMREMWLLVGPSHSIFTEKTKNGQGPSVKDAVNKLLSSSSMPYGELFHFLFNSRLMPLEQAAPILTLFVDFFESVGTPKNQPAFFTQEKTSIFFPTNAPRARFLFKAGMLAHFFSSRLTCPGYHIDNGSAKFGGLASYFEQSVREGDFSQSNQTVRELCRKLFARELKRGAIETLSQLSELFSTAERNGQWPGADSHKYFEVNNSPAYFKDEVSKYVLTSGPDRRFAALHRYLAEASLQPDKIDFLNPFDKLFVQVGIAEEGLVAWINNEDRPFRPDVGAVVRSYRYCQIRNPKAFPPRRED